MKLTASWGWSISTNDSIMIQVKMCCLFGLCCDTRTTDTSISIHIESDFLFQFAIDKIYEWSIKSPRSILNYGRKKHLLIFVIYFWQSKCKCGQRVQKNRKWLYSFVLILFFLHESIVQACIVEKQVNLDWILSETNSIGWRRCIVSIFSRPTTHDQRGKMQINGTNGRIIRPWLKFLRKKRVPETRFSMPAKCVNAGRINEFHIC